MLEILQDNINLPTQSTRETRMRNVVMKRLDKLGIAPNESLGQHFLVNKDAIDLLVHSVNARNTVLEIGAGVGQLTEILAESANRVVAVEIDRRYEPVLNELSGRYPNLNIVYGDALVLRLQDFIVSQDGSGAQIIASLPYHITEPFMRRLTSLNIESATMVVGRKLTESIQATTEESVGFGKLTLLTQSFFDAEVLMQLGRDSFSPSPRTESSIIRLSPKEGREGPSNMRDFLLRRFFNTSRKSPLVKNCLKEGLTEFMERQDLGILSKRERNQRIRKRVKLDLKNLVEEYNEFGKINAVSDDSNRKSHFLRIEERAIIDGLGIPSEILGKPFDRLSNPDLRILSVALRSNSSQ